MLDPSLEITCTPLGNGVRCFSIRSYRKDSHFEGDDFKKKLSTFCPELVHDGEMSDSEAHHLSTASLTH